MDPSAATVETWERRPGAACAPLGAYRRREPERTLLHAVVRERLCRHSVRPPFALHRLSQGPDGRLVYRMKRPRGGSLFLVLTPDELLSRIVTLVPPPRTHALRYHGLFAPNSKHRRRVVPAGAGSKPAGHAPGHAAPTDSDPAPATPAALARPADEPAAFRLTSPEADIST